MLSRRVMKAYWKTNSEFLCDFESKKWTNRLNLGLSLNHKSIPIQFLTRNDDYFEDLIFHRTVKTGRIKASYKIIKDIMIFNRPTRLFNILTINLVALFLGIACNQSEPEPQVSPDNETQLSKQMTVGDLNVVDEFDPAKIALKTKDAELTIEVVADGSEEVVKSFYTPSYFTDVIEDGDTVWIASDAGLLHWDLATGNLRQFLAPQTPLPDNNVSSMTEKDGKLYLATRTGVAIFDKKLEWQVYSNEEIGAEWGYGRPSAWIGGDLWVGSDNGIAVLKSSGIWESIDSSKLPYSNVREIKGKDGGVYIEVHDGNWGDLQEAALLYKNGEWLELGPAEKEKSIEKNGTTWQVTDGDGDNTYEDVLLKSEDKGETWQQILRHHTFLKIIEITDSGTVYLDGRGELFVFENDQLSSYQYTAIGPEVNYINHIVVDEENHIWLGTDGRGLTGFDGNKWRNWQPEFREDMRAGAIRGLAAGNGYVYAGAFASSASGGLMIYDVKNDAWENHWPTASGACPELQPKDEDLQIRSQWEVRDRQACEYMNLGNISAGGVGAITIDSDGNAYFANAEGFLDIYSRDSGRWKTMQIVLSESEEGADEDLSIKIINLSSGAYDAIESHNGDILIATGGGIYRLNGSTFELVYARGAKSIVEDQNGTIWAGSDSGLVRINKEGMVQVFDETNSALIEGHRLTDIALGPDGKIWGIGFNIFFSFNGTDWHIIDPAIIGQKNWGDTLAFDNDGNLWVESYNGLMQFPSSKLP